MCHVLIIEDEPIIAMDLREILEEEGATSFAFAASEAEAVTEALAKRPALITSDVNLTSGTGPQAVTQIYALLGAIPVIYITGKPHDCEPCKPNGMILGKPLNEADVKRAFHKLRP